MEIKSLTTDGQGRATLGAEYADSSVTVAISEDDEVAEWSSIKETMLYFRAEIVTQFSCELATTIEERIDDVDVTIDNTDTQAPDAFTLTVSASPTVVTKPEMESAVQQVDRILNSYDHPIERQSSKLHVVESDDKMVGVEQHQRLVRYVIGPVNIDNLSTGYLI
jgi:hypothetical protein